jgi:His/Glu/Gln/Arg/opine family amino acid ABC transporter permease subunit
MPVVPADGFDIAGAFAGDQADPKLPPPEPAVPPGKWIKDNLFSSVGSGILTVVFGIIAFFTFRGLLDFAFHNPARNWRAVPTNIRLMMTQAYPADSYERVWISVAIIAVLAGLTLGMSKHTPYIGLRKLLNGSMALGGVIIAGALLIKNNIQTDPETGEFIRDEAAEVLRVGRGEALSGRWWVFLIGALMIAVPLVISQVLGDRRRFINYNFHHVVFAFLGLAVLSLWVVPYGQYGLLDDGSFIAEKGVTVASSTKFPWTIEWLILGIAYVVGLSLPDNSRIKTGIYLGWFLSPYVIIFAILRAPIMDWGTVFTTDLTWFLGFAIVGGAIMWFLTTPGLGERGRVVAFVLLLVAALHWIAAYFGWYDFLGGWFDMQQKNRLSITVLALFALGAHNFAGVTKVRRSYVLIWVGVMFAMHALITVINTPSALDDIPADSFIGGFLMSLVLSVFSLTLAFPVGVIFALARTSKLPIFRLLSTLFIEVSRGVPLITVLFFFATVIPLFLPEGMEITKLAAAVVALVLFSSAYVAENIRGGLQSVRRGQFEAADAMGLTTAQRTSLIVLPQALRVSIPPLVGQAIATYKETSLIAIIGLFDLLLIANRTIPAQSVFRGNRFEPLLFACVVYWVGAYSMSRYSRSIEQRLGVGSR